MGVRIRKSISIAPGVRMTFSKSGIGYSVGVKGYRVTRRADGRVQRTLSVPGTGLSHVTTSTASGSRRSVPPPAPAPRPALPGLFAPRGEKELYKALRSNDVDAMERVERTYPAYALAAATLAGVLRLSKGEDAPARALLGRVFASGRDPAGDPFLEKYVTARLSLHVADGVMADVGLDRNGVGLALAELDQAAGDLDAAIGVVEQLEPTATTALALAELYSAAGRHHEVVAMTDGVTNDDDATALLCVLRGVALREEGFFDAARAAFTEALKSKKREPVIRHRALLERARSYEAEGKRAMARKDLERILAEDSHYEGLAEALAELDT